MKKLSKIFLIMLFSIFLVTGCGNKKFENQNKVLGKYTRQIFSGNTFEYVTLYDTATFKFYPDSTFECSYKGGATYKGTYEVYNGLNISIKADDIKNDSSISGAEQLAIDIENVTNAMMNKGDLLNTYLLYLKVNEMVNNGVSKSVDILQPFALLYDESSKSGQIVNIMGRTQGTFILK